MNSIIKNDLYKIKKSVSMIILVFVFWIIPILAIMEVKLKFNIIFFDSFKLFIMMSNLAVLIWAIMYFGKYMSDENKEGTIKLSLMSNISRKEIIIAKFLVYLITSFVIMIANIVIGFAISSIFFYTTISVKISSIFINAFLAIIPFLAIGALVLFISIIVEKGSYLVYVMITFYFFGSKFLINVDNLSIFNPASNNFLGVIKWDNIVLSIICIIIFLVLSIFVFEKKQFQ